MKNKTQLFILYFLSGLIGLLLANNQPDSLDWNAYNIPAVGELDWIESNYTYDYDIIDVDRDDIEEVVILRKDFDYPLQLTARELDHEIYAILPRPVLLNENYRGINSSHCLYHFENTRYFDLMIYNPDSAQGIIRFYNSNLTQIDSIVTVRGFSKSQTREWNGYLYLWQMADLNNDGRLDLISLVNTASDGQPRAIIAYDIYTKKELLHLKFAPMIQHYTIVDFEDDGEYEIVVELIGAGDGAFFGPFKRNESYVAIFNLQGELLHSWEHAGPATYVGTFIHDITNDGILDILISYRSRAATSGLPSRIDLINGATMNVEAKIENTQTFSRYGRGRWYLKDQNGKFLFTVLNEDGEIILIEYNPDLKEFKELRFVRNILFELQSKYGERYYSDDINGDGTEEIFIADSKTNKIWIVRPDLIPLAYIPVETVRKFSIKLLSTSSSKKREYALFNNNQLHKLSIDVDDVFPPATLAFHWGAFQFKLNKLATGFILSALVSLIVLAIIFAKKTRQSLYYTALFNSTHVASFLIDSKNRFRWGNSHFLQLVQSSLHEIRMLPCYQVLEKSRMTPLARQIQLFIKSESVWEHREIQIGSGSQTRNVALELHRTKQKSVQGMFVDLTESTQTERIRIWSAMAQRIVHKTKTPLGTVMLAIQRLQRSYHKESPKQAEQYDTFVNAAISEIARVRDDINTFMKFARLNEPELQKKAVKPFLQNMIQLYERRLPEGIHIEQEMDPEIYCVLIDESQMQEALFNLIDNGIAAMDNQGLIKISLTYEKEPLYGSCFANIDIIDQGRGIDEKDLKKIFDAGFTTSTQSTGMGLLIAKNIVEQHQGEIRVHSRPGIGSTFSVRLLIVEESENE